MAKGFSILTGKREEYDEETYKKIPENKKIDFIELEVEEEFRYRCEQNIITKINGIPTTTAKTKRDFLIKKKIIDKNLFVQVSIEDNIIVVTPNQYQEAINLVAQLDYIKCDAIIVKVNTTTGEIQHIVNHTDIIDKWKTYKLQLESSYSTIENKEAVEALKEFISMVNKQITIETHLIDDLKTKMFFDVYFNKHLVDSSEKLQPYQRTFSSQLFKNINVDLQIRQDLLNDNEEEIQVRKVSEMTKGIEKLPKIIESYDKTYKPMIEYKFSEYKASFRERAIYNKQAYFLKESEITILEEVKNNIQLLVHYTLKKID